MRKKSIHHLAFDLFHEVLDAHKHTRLSLVRFKDLPRIEFTQSVITLESFDTTVTSIVPTTKWKTNSIVGVSSVNDFLQKKDVVTHRVVLMYGVYRYNAHVSLREYSPLKQEDIPPPLIVEVNAGKLTPSGMLVPHVHIKEYTLTKTLDPILSFFRNTYRTLRLSEGYIEDILPWDSSEMSEGLFQSGHEKKEYLYPFLRKR
jgi:hypothetical protein